MSYHYLCAVILVLTLGSDLSAMQLPSLKELLVRKLASSEGKENIPIPMELEVPADVEELIEHKKVTYHCKAHLPEAYYSYVRKYVLQMRKPGEPKHKDHVYLCDQVTQDMGAVTGLTFVGSSHLAVVLGKKGFMQWWDTDTGILLHEMKLDKVYARVASSRQGSFIAAIHNNEVAGNEVALWSTETRQKTCVLMHEEPVARVAFCPETKYLVAGSKLGKVTVWDLKTNKCIKEYIHFRNQPPYVTIDAVRITPAHVIAVSDNVIKLWCRETDQETTIEVPLGHNRCLSSHLISDTKAMICLSNKTIVEVSLPEASLPEAGLPEGAQRALTFNGSFIRGIETCCFSEDGRLAILGERKQNSFWQLSEENQYEYRDHFCGGSTFNHLALRDDGLAYIASERSGGLQLCSIAPNVKGIGLKEAEEALHKKRKVAMR